MKYFNHPLLLMLLASVLLIKCSANEPVSEKEHVDPNIDSLPELKLVTLQGDTVTNHDFPANKRLVFMFISPECEHCQKEMEIFPEESFKLKNAQVIVVSPYNEDLVKNFAEKYGLIANPKIDVLLDPLHEFDSKLLPDQTPIIYLFNEKRQFVGVVRDNRTAKNINGIFEDFGN